MTLIIYVSAKQTIPLIYFELPSYGIPNLTVITLCVLFIAQDDYDYLVESWQGNILSAEIKGQLISKGLFKVFICTKKRTKIFLYFCPSL